jgi:hypothetical protein
LDGAIRLTWLVALFQVACVGAPAGSSSTQEDAALGNLDGGGAALDGSTPIALSTAVGVPTGDPATAMIDAAGGQLTSSDGRLTLTVPAGAVAVATEFAIQPITAPPPFGIGKAYRLTPDGQTFAPPATLTLHYGDADLAGTAPPWLRFAYQDPTTHGWRAAADPVLDDSARTVKVPIGHFSDWTILPGLSLFPPDSSLSPGQTTSLMPIECTAAGDGYVDCIVTSKPVTGWAVNRQPLGAPDVGTLAPAGPMATYKAPQQAPSVNPVTVSAQVAGNTGGTMLSATIFIGSAYYVDGTLHVPAYDPCGTGLASAPMDATLNFEMRVTEAGSQYPTFTVNDWSERASLGGPLMSSQPHISVTIDTKWDFYLSGVAGAVQEAGATARRFFVLTKRLWAACTLNFDSGGSTMISQDHLSDDTLEYEFDPASFMNDKLTVTSEGSYPWKLTIHRSR